MLDVKSRAIGGQFFTGASRFLQANEHFMEALLQASTRCSIHASEDIYDANGLKLWARGRLVDNHLLERLSNRKLRKPIELCVYAADPVATAAIAETVELKVAASPDLSAALEPNLDVVLRVVGSMVPSPTELLLFSLLRHGTRNMIDHAAVVSAIALGVASAVGVDAETMRALARAALLHDVGELYLPPSLFASTEALSAAEIVGLRNHTVIGAQVAIELARSSANIGQWIAMSHERHDGTGYPRGLKASEIPAPAQALLFAEAMATHFETQANAARRATLAVRIAPHEFAPEVATWIARVAQTRPPVMHGLPDAESIGLQLREIQSRFARVTVLLSMPIGESKDVRAALAQWHPKVDSLLWMLRTSGIEEAIQCGQNVTPQSDVERIELVGLIEELHYRLQELRMRVESARAENRELARSQLVADLLGELAAGVALGGDAPAQASQQDSA